MNEGLKYLVTWCCFVTNFPDMENERKASLFSLSLYSSPNHEAVYQFNNLKYPGPLKKYLGWTVSHSGTLLISKILIQFFWCLSLRPLRSSSAGRLSTWCPTRGRLGMCTASGRTLPSPARSLGPVLLTLAHSRTGPAAMGMARAGPKARQTQ